MVPATNLLNSQWSNSSRGASNAGFKNILEDLTKKSEDITRELKLVLDKFSFFGYVGVFSDVRHIFFVTAGNLMSQTSRMSV